MTGVAVPTALALLAVAAGRTAQGGPDEATAVREFQRSFTSTKRRPRTVADRRAALAKLAGRDSVRIARVLARAFRSVEAEIAAEDARRIAINDELAEIIRGKEHQENRRIDGKKYPRYQELVILSQTQRAALDGLRGLQRAVGDRIRALRRDETLAWLVRNVLTDRSLPLLLKVTVASTAARVEGGLLDELGRALARARRPEDLAALLDGIGRAGRDAGSLGPAVVKLFGHADPRVREGAAVCSARIGYAGAVAPLIDLLAISKGQGQRRVGLALEDLTGQRHGTSVASWRGWYEKEGKILVAGGDRKAMFDTRRRPAADQSRYYMGIPQDGAAIVYVIDSSGSMKKPVNWARPGGHRGGVTVARSRDEAAPGHWATTRLEACKKELIAALARLDRTRTFNVVWYSDLAHVFRDKMQRALPSTIRTAQDWVRQLAPNSRTNIHDALRIAFTFARGRGIRDRAYGKADIGLDTIFLLTDGSPTKPDGTLDDHEKILEAVRRWNPLRRVVIHTIGIGDGLNLPFMRRLAAENGGRFEHYTDTGARRR